MSNKVFHFSNTGISSGQRFYLKDDVSRIFVRNLNIDSNFSVVASNLVYNTGNQTISGVKSFTNNLVFQDNLLQSSQPSGYLTGVGYSGNYDGGYFLGRTKLSQNTSRLVDSSFGNNFISKTTNKAWVGISASSDAKYQSAVVNNEYIYISSDFGNTWMAKMTDASRAWSSISISSDGKYQTAVVSFGFIYISSDYGNTWMAKITSAGGGWSGISISSDGKYQTAVAAPGQIYISSDYGNTWTAKESVRNWNGISISSDGKYQTAINLGGQIYVSSDYGNSWAARESNRTWYGISISSDGKYQSAVGINGINVYISSNYGNTWSPKAEVGNYGSISISSDGKYQVSTSSSGLSISTNYGNTWIIKNNAISGWTKCFVNSDGKYIIASAFNKAIYVSKTDELIDGSLYVDNLYTNNLVLQDNLFQSSQPSGYLTGIGYSGNYDGGYFLGRTKLSQNTSRLIDSSFGNTWVAKESSRFWNDISISSDGKYQSTIVSNGRIYVSSDYGNSWVVKESSRLWNGISISSDGKYQSATVSSGQIYVSSDYGNTWVAKESDRSWIGISISSDGKYQSAVVFGGQIYVSSDYGNTWNAKESVRGWNGISISSDGKYQSAIVYSGQIYVSSDYGNSWVAKESSREWTHVSISSDGKYQSAIVGSGQIYVSSDYGNSWVAKESIRLWRGISISSDGKYQTAVVGGGQIYVSSDYGNSWIAKESNRNWISVSISSDGKYQSATANGGQIYTSKTDEQIDGNLYADNLVYNIGDQNVSGIKTFASRPTVNGTGVLLIGEASSTVLPDTIVYTTGDQIISGNKIFNSLRIEPSGRAFNIGTGLNINSESGIVRINTNVSSSLGAGFTYALTSAMDPNRPLDIEGRGRLVHGLSLDAGSANFTNASDHFHLFFSAGPNNPGSFNGTYSTDTNTNYKSYQFSPTTRPNGNDNLRDLIHLTTLEAKGAGDQTFPTSNLTELYLTTTGTTVVTPPGTGLVELAYAINSQPTSQYLHSTGDLVYLRVFPGVAGIVANTYNGTVVTRATGLDPAYSSTNVYKVGIALGALNVNNNFVPAQRGTSTQTDAWTLTRSTPSNAFTGITRIERNSSQYLDQFNVFYTSPITGYTGESVVVDVFNRGAGTFIASGITLTQARYDGYVSKVLSSTGLEITLSVMNFGSLGGVGRPGAFHNPPLTTGSAFISSEDLITGMKILRGSSDSVHRNYWAHNVFAGFRNLDANQLNVPAGVITRVAVGGLNRVESASTSAFGFNNKAYGFNSHAYGAHQENYNRDSVRIGATNESYINIVSGKLGVNVVSPSATIDIGTGNLIAGAGIFDAIDLNNIDTLNLSGIDISITNGNVSLTNRPTVNGTGVLLIGEAANVTLPGTIVYTTGNQIISGVKTFANGANQILNATYSNLTGLKAISGLLSGQLYRISDFVLKWNNQSINDQTVKTAASGEPLIVTALSNKEIYHLAQSEIYPQDTIYYNINATGSYSWGTINNNAAIPNFKGWIYRRVDNLLDIDMPYDWRNITVNCCKPNVSSVPNYSSNVQYSRLSYVKEPANNSNRGKLYYSVVTGNSGNALNNTNFWSPISSFVESGTFFSTDEIYGFQALIPPDSIPIINLPADTGSRIQQPTFTSTLTGLGQFILNNVKNIKIEGNGYSNVIVGNSFISNTIGSNFINNTIGSNFAYNVISNNFSNNTISNIFSSNTIGNAFRYNVTSNTFSNNTIGNLFHSNTIGNSSNNTIGNNFYSNAISNDFNNNAIANIFYNTMISKNFNYNTIGNIFSDSVIGQNFISNTVGNNFFSNIIGNNSDSNTIGNNFTSNTIGNLFEVNTIGNYFYSNTIGNGFFGNTAEGEFSNVNFSTATHVYNIYNTTLFRNSDNSARLRYFNSSDQLVVTDPTA